MAADALARMGSKREHVPPDVFLQHLHVPSIKGGDKDKPEAAQLVAVYMIMPDWTNPYLDFLL